MSVIGRLLGELADVVHVPGDDEYAAATRPDNSSFPQRPRAVVRPRSADEAARAVQIIASMGIRIAVQATGHGAGAPIDEADVLLDTSALDTVSVDVGARTARVGAGSMWPGVQEAAAPYGLLGLSGTSPTVGVAGYTFGGGVGWFVRKFGLAAAALRSVEYVDGSGRLRTASLDAVDAVDREALWAFRGVAPVGLATSVEIGLFPVADLWTGYLLWPASALSGVVAAWTQGIAAVDESVTSALSLLRLPPEGPFPDELLGTSVVHLSYASPDGGRPLGVMRDAVRAVATPVVDTTGPGDRTSLSAIHLDPPRAVPARGTGRWLDSNATDVATAMFAVARIGEPHGLSMIELRHTESKAAAHAGAPAPFLMHAVGAATDDAARGKIDDVLRRVEAAGHPADIGRAAPSFREGQPDAADALAPGDVGRVRAARNALDPDRTFVFQRHLESARGADAPPGAV
jgi:FAD/FMN-containing dehydrogenase